MAPSAYRGRMTNSTTDNPRDSWAWKKARARLTRAVERETRKTGVPPMCALCSQAIDLSLPYTDKGALSWDHIVPVSRGGDLTDPENLRMTHRGCNSRRGAGRKRTERTRQQWARADRPRTLLDW